MGGNYRPGQWNRLNTLREFAAGRPENLYDDCLYLEPDIDSCFQPGDPHGSLIAGVISARSNDTGYVGIAHNPGNFASVRVCATRTNCTWSDLAAGLDWATSTGYQRHIVNISLQGCAGTTQLTTAIAAAADAGIVIVAIAGNLSKSCADNPTGVLYPAFDNRVIAVSGTGPNDEFAVADTTCSTGSRYGPQVDLSAPFWAHTMTSNGAWGIACGTSLAAPVVVGVAALIWSYNSAWSATDLRNYLQSTAIDLGVAGHDNYFGYGRVTALYIIYNEPPPTITPVLAGPYQVPTSETCIWNGGATGGTTPHSLVWRINGTIQQIGGTSFSWASASSFTLTLDAFDANGFPGTLDRSITVVANGSCAEE